MAPRRSSVKAEIKSDSESSATPEVLDSGAVTPSTAATSLNGRKRVRAEDNSPSVTKADVKDDEETEEDEVKAQSRTPRRQSAVAASQKLAQKATPVITIDSSELSSAEDEPKAKARRQAKGKGKAKAESGSDVEMNDLDSQATVSSDDGDNDVAVAKRLARALGSAGRSSAGKLAKSITSRVQSSRASRASSSSKASKSKAKGKKRAASSDDFDDDSDDAFEPGSDQASDDIADFEELETFRSDESEFDGDDSDVEIIAEVSDKWKKKQREKKAARDARAKLPKVPMRGGAEFSKEEKAKMKKMTPYQKGEAALKANHPELVSCWEDLAATALTKVERAAQPPGLTQKLLPFQLEGLNWMTKQENGRFGGGFLCDEMGMGKTIQTISLILSDYEKGKNKCTLVLAPTVAIVQWRNEIQKFTEGFNVLIYHGANRIDDAREMAKFDVVLTSYAVMESSFRREHKGFQRKGRLMKEDSILHKVKWHRVILDEAHNIKDRAANTAKAAFALQARFRWCLSGTPLQNRVGELYSLVRFVGCDPFAHYFCKKCDCKSLHWLSNAGACSECGHSAMQHVCYWNNEVLKPIQYGGASSGEGLVAFGKLETLLKRLMLRRTKVERADDLGLPPRVVKVRRDYFTEEEEELYKSLFQDVKRKFNTYADEGTVLNNYSNIFTLITRMRQLADHPDLVIKSKSAQAVGHAPADLPEDIITCRICLDEAEDAVKTSSCRHLFCRECIRQYLETATVQQPDCPACHQPITIDLDQEAVEQDTTGRQGFLSRIDPSKSRTSTKIEALLEELSKLKREDCTLKSIVFSQFTTMLDLVARRLQLSGFKFVRLQGTMTPTARDNTIQHFMKTPDCTVFLISLKAGGVALNLTEASSVFLLDPWWNPAVELQAMDRIHRLGQHRPITVTRLIIENSIESRILDLQRKKENLAASALGDDDKAMGRLTPDDLRFLFQL